MADAKPSYDVSCFDNIDQEIDRLDQQQSIAEKIETSFLRENGMSDNSSILEIGAGTGVVSKMLKKISPKGQLVSIELDPRFCEIWKKNMKGVENISLVEGNAYKILPKLDQEFDFIYFRYVLQHVPEPLKLLKLAHEKLKPGAKIIGVDSDDQLSFCYPKSELLQSLLSRAQERQSHRKGDRHIGRKIPFLLKKSGCNNIESRSLTFTQNHIPFDSLWNMNMGFKSSLLPPQDTKRVFESLRDLANRNELFYHVGIIVSVGIK